MLSSSLIFRLDLIYGILDIWMRLLKLFLFLSLPLSYTGLSGLLSERSCEVLHNIIFTAQAPCYFHSMNIFVVDVISNNVVP